jgi:hypothetical protein
MRPEIKKSTLHWSGEHWVLMLRVPGGNEPDAIVSHFSLRYSPGGEGNVAVVRLGGEEGFHAVCTDNPEAASFALGQFFENRVAYFRDDLPRVDAAFTRHGDTRRASGWVIETEQHRIVTRWDITEPPVIADGPFRSGSEMFTVLFFTHSASVELDGNPLPGQPFLRDIWRPSIGGDRSSCVFALAETFLETGDPAAEAKREAGS